MNPTKKVWFCLAERIVTYPTRKSCPSHFDFKKPWGQTKQFAAEELEPISLFLSLGKLTTNLNTNLKTLTNKNCDRSRTLYSSAVCKQALPSFKYQVRKLIFVYQCRICLKKPDFLTVQVSKNLSELFPNNFSAYWIRTVFGDGVRLVEGEGEVKWLEMWLDLSLVRELGRLLVKGFRFGGFSFDFL